MDLRRNRGCCWIGIAWLALTVTGCAAITETDPSPPRAFSGDTIIVALTPDIEALYLAWHELDQVYKDIKYLERAFLFEPDGQLGTIQKVSLYIQDASVRIHHQWDRLSVLDYIRPEMMRDYLTLCVKDLRSAIDEIGYDQLFLKIYGPDVKHPDVTRALDSATGHIEKNKGLLNQILDTLIPLAHPAVSPAA
jgi:hypothetical protein